MGKPIFFGIKGIIGGQIPEIPALELDGGSQRREGSLFFAT